MKQLPFRQKKNVLRISFVLALVSIVLTLCMSAGNWLVMKDKPFQSDACIILMGSIADRVLEASDVFKAGLTGRVFIVNNHQYGSEALQAYGVKIPNYAELTKQALIQLGIPDSLIIIIPGNAKSTRDEAKTLASYLVNHTSIHYISLVSSSAHTRRANMIFEDSFSDLALEVRLISIPSKYSGFNANQWWKDRESAKQVLEEYVKLMSFLLVEQFMD